jgi:16S rRNA (cytosine1402-N4)-methyltransferase
MPDLPPDAAHSDLTTPRPPRRKRYSGKNPQHFDLKYKELQGDAETLAKVQAGGKTAAGTHRPIMVDEVLASLEIQPGDCVLDCTLGYGGHTQEMLAAVGATGRVISLDADPVQLPLTVARLAAAGFAEPQFTAVKSNFAGAPKVLAGLGSTGANVILADLGLSSMQIDNPTRGFSYKFDGPLDMRMNPERGKSAADFLAGVSVEKLARIFSENADEPAAEWLAADLAGRKFTTTLELAAEVTRLSDNADPETTVRRVFQALRIAVNEEFSALETLLRVLPDLLLPGGRVAILSFHSGEDRRVKKSFSAGWQSGIYQAISAEMQQPTGEEIFRNPRASSAKLRWAVRS